MAVEIGTASHHKDLLDKLRLFLTTNTDLVTAGQEWTTLSWANVAGEDELILRGRGMSGLENIHIGLRSYSDVSNDRYGWELKGYSGYNAGASWSTHPGYSGASYVALSNFTPADPLRIPYWFVANGQRVVVVAKIETTYHACYLGKFLPYATPEQYPSPLFIGGENSSQIGYYNTAHETRHFADPGLGTRYQNLDGAWFVVQNFYSSSGSEADKYDNTIWPFQGSGSSSDANIDYVRGMRENIDGTYPILPLILNTNTPAVASLGELDGCFWTTGFGAAAEDIITIGGASYLVVQNVHRSASYYHWALKLE